MSSSRRKKSYDNKLRQFQNRNVFAGIVLAIAFGFAIWLMIWVIPGDAPRVYLSTTWIDYTKSQREIPFASESCSELIDSCGESFKKGLLKLTQEVPHQLDDNTSRLKLGEGKVRNKDVLFVYLNGHLVPGEDSESIEYLPAGDYVGDDQRVDFKSLLEQINESKGKLKILFLDAGRYTRSPVFPARELNNFQQRLDVALKSNEYELKPNFWIIVSHSEKEYSRASTLFKSSIFSKAVAESIRALAAKGESRNISVEELFEHIRGRTMSWSRNLGQKATQQPILMRPGFGNLGDSPTPDPEDENSQWRVAFAKPADPEDGTNKKVPEEKKRRPFSRRSVGFEMATKLRDDFRYDAMPRETVAHLETFLEIGKVNAAEGGEIDAYKSALSSQPDEPQKTDFNRGKLDSKQTAIHEFRQAMLGLTVLTRFQNELKHWEADDVDKELEALRKPSASLLKIDLISDDTLQFDKAVPAQCSQFVNEFKEYLRNHKRLLDEVNVLLQVKPTESLSPTEVEMLGRVANRYLPIIAEFAPKDDISDPADAEDQPAKKVANEPEESIEFALDLNLMKRNASNRADSEFSYDQRTGALGNNFESPKNDTDYRFWLAAQGSEEVPRFDVSVPGIAWKEISPNVDVQLASGGTSAQVNPAENSEPVKLKIETKLVDFVDLEVAKVGDKELPPGLVFGFGQSSFENTQKVKAGDTVDLWFKDVNFGRYLDKIGRSSDTFPFEVTANGKGAETETFRFDVILTRDSALVLSAFRKLSKATSRKPALRWGGAFASGSKPLMIKSLANMESGFELAIENRTPKARNLTFAIYNIRKDECRVSGVRPDRVDKIQELSGWLMRMDIEKDLPDEFRLVGRTDEFVLPPKSEPMPLVFIAQNATKKEEEESFGLQEVDHFLLLVGSESGEKKSWYQWIGFQPQMPADRTANTSVGEGVLRPLQDIMRVFETGDKGQQRGKQEVEAILGQVWSKKKGPVAELAVVSSKTTSRPKLSLQNVFEGEIGEKLPPGKIPDFEERLLVMDLFGVPGYRILSQTGDEIGDHPERNLAALRVVTGKTGVICYPATWSFLNFDETGESQSLFLSRPAEGAKGTLNFEFLLPTVDSNPLASNELEYTLIWNGDRKQRMFPNDRKHFFQVGDAGLIFKSEVAAHRLPEIPPDNISDGSVLTLVRKAASPEDEDKTIGSWNFKTQSYGDPPKLTLSRSNVVAGNLAEVEVKTDFSKIRQPLDWSTVKLFVDEQKIDQFSQDFQKRNADGVYSFNLGAIKEVVDFQPRALPYRVKVAVTDFFGDEQFAFKSLKVSKPAPQKKIVQKKRPARIKHVLLRLPEQLKKAVKNEVKSIKVKPSSGGEKSIPWYGSGMEDGFVARWMKNGTIEIYHLVKGAQRFEPGKYTFSINCVIDDPKIDNGSLQLDLEATADVTANKQEIKMEVSR